MSPDGIGIRKPFAAPRHAAEAGQTVNKVRDAIGAAYIRRYHELAGVESMPIRAWRVLIRRVTLLAGARGG
jgi:hypothetical protein